MLMPNLYSIDQSFDVENCINIGIGLDYAEKKKIICAAVAFRSKKYLHRNKRGLSSLLRGVKFFVLNDK